MYKERNLVERFFGKLKQFRRVATRYDKLLANFKGFILIAAIVIWLKRLHELGVQSQGVVVSCQRQVRY